MVISVKKESEKLLNLSSITKEIIEYCDTKEALENLRDEWSKFYDFRNDLQLIENYTVKNYSDYKSHKYSKDDNHIFDFKKGTSSLNIISDYFKTENPSKWDDLSEDFKFDYNIIYDYLKSNLNELLEQFKNKSLSYDVYKKKFVLSKKSSLSEDYRSFNCLYNGNSCEVIVDTSLLVLVDLTRFSAMSFSYKTKLEFVWFKYIFGLTDIDSFMKELLTQVKRESKTKLKSFVSNFEFEGSYPAMLFGEKFVKDYINKKVLSDREPPSKVTIEKILSTNKDDYFNNILKGCLDISKLSDLKIFTLIRYEPEVFLVGYSDQDDEWKNEFVRGIIRRWSNQKSPFSNPLGKQVLNQYFSRRELFVFFKETLKDRLSLIYNFKNPDSVTQNLLKIEEDIYIPVSGYNVDFKKYLTEDELSELKSELIPILEKIQNEIFVICEGNIWYNISISDLEILTDKELKEKLIKNMDYGNFLIQVFQLLDWYPSKIKLYTSICRPKIKSGKSFGEFDEENLFEIRKKIIKLLSYKKFFDSNKISHIDVEYYVYDYKEFDSSSEYIIENESGFDKIFKESLGDFEKFFEYIGPNVNRDLYKKIKKLIFPRMQEHRTDIFVYRKGE